MVQVVQLVDLQAVVIIIILVAMPIQVIELVVEQQVLPAMVAMLVLLDHLVLQLGGVLAAVAEPVYMAVVAAQVLQVEMACQVVAPLEEMLEVHLALKAAQETLIVGLAALEEFLEVVEVADLRKTMEVAELLVV
jgi:hypothetical protein